MVGSGRRDGGDEIDR